MSSVFKKQSFRRHYSVWVALAVTASAGYSIVNAQNVADEDTHPPQQRRYLNGVYAPVEDPKRLEQIYEIARHESRYVDSIKAARDGFSGLNASSAVDSMTEDAQLLDITDAGVKIKVDGRAQMLANMTRTFSGQASSPAGRWVSEKSGAETWGIYKNIKVSYHYSTFIREDGTEWTRPMIVVAEHKDGKRWREWRFMPVDR